MIVEAAKRLIEGAKIEADLDGARAIVALAEFQELSRLVAAYEEANRIALEVAAEKERLRLEAQRRHQEVWESWDAWYIDGDFSRLGCVPIHFCNGKSAETPHWAFAVRANGGPLVCSECGTEVDARLYEASMPGYKRLRDTVVAPVKGDDGKWVLPEIPA